MHESGQRSFPFLSFLLPDVVLPAVGEGRPLTPFIPPLPLYHLIAPFHNNAELNQLSGIASILNFPLDVEVAEEEDRLELERAKELEKDRRHEQGLS